MNELLVVTPNGYKASKLYSIVPTDGSGDLTWVRNTIATRVNPSGLIESVSANVPRLDYSGGVTCPCVLVEPQRTNLLAYSEEIDNGAWTKSDVTIGVDAVVSPDGTTNADKIIESATNALHYIRQNATVTATTYTLSFFAKADGRSVMFASLDGASNYLWFDLANGTTGGAGSGSSIIENYGNGWYRCSYTYTFGGVASACFLWTAPDTSTIVYLGDGVSGVYVWGTQLEQGTTSSYIPTTSASQTRNADVGTVTTPVGVTSLIETYEDGTTNVVSPIPVTYQISEGRISKVVGL